MAPVLLVLLASATAPAGADAQTLTQNEALRLAFPEADTVERRTAFLTDRELVRARELAGGDVEVESSVVTYYVARKEGAALGVAFFDAHPVRTLPEVLMIVVGVESRIRRIEVVRFAEPPEYRPPDGWLRQFESRALDPELAHRRGVANITGATLTARAVAAAARRILALHAVIRPFDGAGR